MIGQNVRMSLAHFFFREKLRFLDLDTTLRFLVRLSAVFLFSWSTSQCTMYQNLSIHKGFRVSSRGVDQDIDWDFWDRSTNTDPNCRKMGETQWRVKGGDFGYYSYFSTILRVSTSDLANVPSLLGVFDHWPSLSIPGFLSSRYFRMVSRSTSVSSRCSRRSLRKVKKWSKP